jgi:hypothetical protein
MLRHHDVTHQHKVIPLSNSLQHPQEQVAILATAKLAGTLCRRALGGLQRLQEFDDGFLVLPLQFFKFLTYMAGFALVPQDRVAERQGCAIVHQSRTQAHSP